ncbi:ATP-binding protein [Thermodesulfobacteriota bacterium]
MTVDQLSHPLNVDFLSQQTRALYLAGIGVTILAGIISFFLARRLLSPVELLTRGTRDLTSFKFGTRIDVHTKDELGRLAQDFNTMARTLEKYETMRKQWISDISHELRTPLAILQGEIEAMQDGVRKVSKATLASLHSEAKRIGKLVDDLHLLSVADSEKLLYQRDPVPPVSIVRETVAAFKLRLEKAGIDVEFGSTDGERITIAGDSYRLGQLFTNLLENTVRYTDSPGVLRISHDSSVELLTLRFEDSAPGVPEDSLERLFDRLYRLDESRSRSLGGSGLGLAICKEIVEGHDGIIRADHAKLGGLLITIEFPLAPVNE